MDELGLLIGRRPLEATGIDVRLAQPAPEGVGVNPQIPGDLDGREITGPRELHGARAELRGIRRAGWANGSHRMWPSSLLPSLA